MSLPTSQALMADLTLSDKVRQRAERALHCSGFERGLFQAMLSESVSLSAIASSYHSGNRYLRQPMSLTKIERNLLWLINVGVLRREVDGQGITDSFRLTPLGRQIIEPQQTYDASWPLPTPMERMRNGMSRWLHVSI